MKKRRSQSNSPELFDITIIHIDPTDPNGERVRGVKWKNVYANRPNAWKQTLVSIKAWYPTALHVNVYGGHPRAFVEQRKID